MRAPAQWTRLLLCIALVGLAPPALAKSSLLLPFPTELGPVAAVTFDADGQAIGRSEFSLVEIENDRYELNVSMRIATGAVNHVRSEFEVVRATPDSPRQLRMLTEQSQSFDPEGNPLTLLRIDHVQGEATCTPPIHSGDAPSTLTLPSDDRVANTPMHLLFLPLVRGEVERVKFQLFVCRNGAKIHEFVALPGGPPVTRNGRTIQEIRYGPDLGRLVSWVASRVLPKLSFWFDTTRDGMYVGHRMPIYAAGPEILMVRTGIQPTALGGAF
jgi:hypothetical protein